MKKLIFTLSTLMICSASMMAIPAKPGQWKMLKLANGTEIRAELVGDELCHYWLANDGKGYAWSAAQGCYVAIDKEAAHKEADQKRNAANKRRMAKATKAKANDLYTGEKKGLIILVEFPKRTATNTPEVKFSTENAQEFYNRVANEEGFSDPKTGFTESVYDYFLAQSSGKFKFKFDVVGPYKLGNTYNYYGEDSGGMQDAHLGKFIYDACRKADGDVNFADYDWDGDGKVDQLFILYAGQGQNVNGADTGLIWPQEGSLNSVGSDQQPFEMDGVTIDSYACSCELGENKVIDGIGTICHEFSHCFGLPDTYDKGTSFGQTELKYGTYVWDLMNNGNYLNGGYTPAAYTALERMLTGWKEPIVLDKDADIVNMKPLADDGDTYIIYNDGYKDEFYMLENRQKQGNEAGLYASGLMITHVDYSQEAWEANDVNTTRERYAIMAADNSKARTIPDVEGDLYPFNGNNSFGNTTIPAATLNHANTDGSKLLNKEITDITQNADGTISFKFRNNNTTGISEINAESSKSAIYNMNGIMMGYDLDKLPKGIYLWKGKKVKK